MKNKTTGARLRVLRGKKTIREAAKDCGISYSALAMYESGKRVPRDEIKVRLAEYYKTSVESIFYAK